MNPHVKLRRERGVFPRLRVAITLVELTLSLALAAIVVAIAVRAYSNAQENNRIHATVQQVALVRQAALNLTLGDPTLVLSPDLVRLQLPPSYYDDARHAIINPFGGQTYPMRDGQTQLAILVTNLTPAACMKLAAADYGRDAQSILIGADSGFDTMWVGTHGFPPPVAPQYITDACSQGQNFQVGIVYR